MGKRLRKKAGARITLYHSTSIAMLELIYQSGAIMPGGYTGEVGGGSTSYDSNGNKLPSKQQDCVYLGDGTPNIDYTVYTTSRPRTNGGVNFGVKIRVEVDEDALGPDRDDLPTGKSWEDTLNRIHQCVHYGPIYLNEITGVQLTSDVHLYGERGTKFNELFQTNTWYSLDEFMQKLTEFDNFNPNSYSYTARLKLKKKAGARITLYHNTSMERLNQIMQSGQMMPGGYTGNVSGGHPEGGPSGQEDGVYLSNTNKTTYSQEAMNTGDRADGCPNFGVCIRVDVDEDALGPDMDDWPYYREEGYSQSDDPEWKQSLDDCGQCIHYGPVFLDEITGVRYTGNMQENNGVIEAFQTSFDILSDDFVPLDKFMEEVKEFDTWYLQMLEDLNAKDIQRSAGSRLRLKKQAGMITLFHDTSVAHLKEIVADGEIKPSGETGYVSGGSYSEDDEDNDMSGQLDCVYLSEKSKASLYSRSALLMKDSDDGGLNFGVTIKISVPENSLVPDYDDWAGEEDSSDTPAWIQSLRECGQCAHKGSISLNQVEGVCFNGELLDLGGTQQEREIREIIGTEYQPIETFMNKVKELDDWYKQWSQTVVASKVSRLLHGGECR